MLISRSYLPRVAHLRFLEESYQCSWVTPSERYGGNIHFIARVSIYLAVVGDRKAQLSSFPQHPAVILDGSGMCCRVDSNLSFPKINLMIPFCLPKFGKC